MERRGSCMVTAVKAPRPVLAGLGAPLLAGLPCCHQPASLVHQSFGSTLLARHVPASLQARPHHLGIQALLMLQHARADTPVGLHGAKVGAVWDVAAEVQELMPYSTERRGVHQYLHAAILGMGLQLTVVQDCIRKHAALAQLAARLSFAHHSEQSPDSTWPP